MEGDRDSAGWFEVFEGEFVLLGEDVAARAFYLVDHYVQHACEPAAGLEGLVYRERAVQGVQVFAYA